MDSIQFNLWITIQIKSPFFTLLCVYNIGNDRRQVAAKIYHEFLPLYSCQFMQFSINTVSFPRKRYSIWLGENMLIPRILITPRSEPVKTSPHLVTSHIKKTGFEPNASVIS